MLCHKITVFEKLLGWVNMAQFPLLQFVVPSPWIPFMACHLGMWGTVIHLFNNFVYSPNIYREIIRHINTMFLLPQLDSFLDFQGKVYAISQVSGKYRFHIYSCIYLIHVQHVSSLLFSCLQYMFKHFVGIIKLYMCTFTLLSPFYRYTLKDLNQALSLNSIFATMKIKEILLIQENKYVLCTILDFEYKLAI